MELRDRDGLPVRGIGTLEVSLHQGGARGEAILTRRSWDIDLGNARDNLAAFDSMTRTYVIREGLAREVVPRLPTLSATLRMPDGQVLRGEGSLRVLGDQRDARQPLAE